MKRSLGPSASYRQEADGGYSGAKSVFVQKDDFKGHNESPKEEARGTENSSQSRAELGSRNW